MKSQSWSRWNEDDCELLCEWRVLRRAGLYMMGCCCDRLVVSLMQFSRAACVCRNNSRDSARRRDSCRLNHIHSACAFTPTRRRWIRKQEKKGKRNEREYLLNDGNAAKKRK